jgi:hypothetical protein
MHWSSSFKDAERRRAVRGGKWKLGAVHGMPWEVAGLSAKWKSAPQERRRRSQVAPGGWFESLTTGPRGGAAARRQVGWTSRSRGGGPMGVTSNRISNKGSG